MLSRLSLSGMSALLVLPLPEFLSSLCDPPEVTQLVSARAGIWIQICLNSKAPLFTLFSALLFSDVGSHSSGLKLFLIPGLFCCVLLLLCKTGVEFFRIRESSPGLGLRVGDAGC